MTKFGVFIALLFSIGCAKPEPLNILHYMCSTHRDFTNMQKFADTSKCQRVIRNGETINGYEISIDVPDSDTGGILPVTLKKSEGITQKGFMLFLPVVF